MYSEIIGDDVPQLTVVACLHGDETGGRDAARAVLDNYSGNPTLQLIVANEKAIEAGERYIETDLNRAFPGDPGAETHERRLAADLLEIIEAPILDLHTTPSTDNPFCVVAGIDDATARLCRATGLERIVDIGYESGGLIQHISGISVECGRRGTQEAIENGKTILKNVIETLRNERNSGSSDPTVYRITGDINRQDDMVFLGNDFKQVEEGEVFATADGEDVVAEKAFYPVLASTDGYEERLGYTAKRVGTLSEYKTLRGQDSNHA